MTSISQWLNDHLPTDADLGITPKDLNRSAKDLDRAAKQTDSSIAKAFYATTGAVFEFGRNVCTPFNETVADLDRIARQSDFKISKWGTYGVGAFFATGAQAFKLPHDVVMGTADFVADPVTAVKSIPAAVEQNGNAIIGGVQSVFSGNVATGMTQLWSGAIGNSMIAAMALGVVKGAPKAYAAYADGMNGLAKMSRGNRIPTDAFDRAAQSPGFGGIRLPKAISEWLGLEDYQKTGDVSWRKNTVEYAKYKARARAGDFRNQDASYQLFEKLIGEQGTELRSSSILPIETLMLSPERLSQLPDGTVVWHIANGGTRAIKGTDFQSADIPNMKTANGMTYYGLRPRPSPR